MDVRGWSRATPPGPGPLHNVIGPDINLNFPEAQVGCEALEAVRWLYFCEADCLPLLSFSIKLVCVRWLWTAGWLRNRSLTVPGPVSDWPCRAVTPSRPGYAMHCPAKDSGSPVPWPWSVIYLRTWVTLEPPVGLLYRFGKFQTGSLDTSWAEAKFGNTSLKFF